MVSVGILHSLSGSMAISEAALKDAALLAIAEINQQGGVLGEEILPLIEDGCSNPKIFASKAKRLIRRQQVQALFGCWTSTCRKAVQPIVEDQNVMLWYPLQHEGLESSSHIFYTGSCLNQQVIPAVDWLIQQGYHRVYLVGADYIFSRMAHKLIQFQFQSLQGQLCGEQYTLPGHYDFSSVIDDIRAQQPDVVFNTLVGDSNVAFFEQYSDLLSGAKMPPIMALSIAEEEIRHLGSAATNHFVCWNYFQSLESPENDSFVQRFKRQYGHDCVTSDPIESAYTQVYLWKAAVERAQSFECDRVRQAAYGLTLETPSGQIRIDPNHHVWKSSRIGQVKADGQIQILQETDPIQPQPWLGLDLQSFPHAPVMTHLLAEVSGWIHKADELQVTLDCLEKARSQRQEMEAALRVSQLALAQAEAELDISKRLQTMLLPSAAELDTIPDLEIVGTMYPADQVGGDYYEVVHHGQKVYFGIGDVTGHGLESGVVMMMAQIAIRTLIQSQESDRLNLLNTVNRIIYDSMQRLDLDLQMTLMLLEYEAGRVCLYGQHESLIILRHDGRVEEIDTFELGFPLGIEPNISDWLAEHPIELTSGDVLVLYTDGITEAMNLKNEQYGIDRLKKTLASQTQKSVADIHRAILADVQGHIGSQRIFDDMTLLLIQPR